MAGISKVYSGVRDESGFRIINVSYSVGKSGVNEREDVAFVQAMLRLVPDKYVNGMSRYQRPLPNGDYNSKTEKLIFAFQKNSNKFGEEKNPVDGRVTHANGSIYTPGTRKVLTIVALNRAVSESALLNGGENTVEYILQQYPQLLRLGAAKIDL